MIREIKRGVWKRSENNGGFKKLKKYFFKTTHSMHCKNLTGNNPDIWGMTGTFCPLNVFFLKPFEGKIPDIYNYVS